MIRATCGRRCGDKLDDTRVEMVTDVKGATALPWELLRDPKTDEALALRAKSFVRSFNKPRKKFTSRNPPTKCGSCW